MIRLSVSEARALGIALPAGAVGVKVYGASTSKYHAKRTTVDGITFDSAAEARRWSELKLQEKAGTIWDLERQPRFVLHAPSTSGYLRRAAKALATAGLCKIGEYRADFKYHNGTTVPYVVEDVKGVATPLYTWKKKHAEAQYGIRIFEIRSRR